MKPIKAIMLVLVLGLTAMVYATDNRQAPGKEKANTCCCMSAEACCMDAHKHDSSQAIKKSSETGKDAMNCCCASMAGNPKSGIAQQGPSCCKAHHGGNKQADKESSLVSKDSMGCCMGCDGCGQDGAECKTETAKR